MQTKSRCISSPPNLDSWQVKRLAGCVAPVRAPEAMTIFLRCSERGEQGSIPQLRGRQVHTGRGEGSSCYCISPGTQLTYSTASLLTPCPHTKSHQQAHILPCLHCWNIFLLWGLSEMHWKHSSCRDVLCHTSALLSLTVFHQLLFSTTLAILLKASGSAFILHIHSHFLHLSPPSLHQWWEQAFILALYAPNMKTYLSSCRLVHTSIFCSSNPLLLFESHTCLNSLNINWEIEQ